MNQRQHYQITLFVYCCLHAVEHVAPQELEVRSLNHPYSLKTKSSLCHYVVMTRSETKFQAPLNRRYQEVLVKNEHLTIKTMSTGMRGMDNFFLHITESK